MMNILIAGCGYVGRRLATALLKRDYALHALTRSQARAQCLNEHGVPTRALDFDEGHDEGRIELSPSSVIVYFVPPPPRGVQDPCLSAFLQSLNAAPEHIVLISTTGVYGDCGGAWINEAAPLKPQVDRARRRVDAEQRLASWCKTHGVTSTILRVAGIYGPGKLPRARLEQQTPVLAESESPYSNRIHVDDLVTACIAALETPGVFHLSDGHPSTMTDYFNHVADALQLPRPPQLSAAQAAQQLSSEMMGYLAESKRLDISRMRDVLGVNPQYTDLRQGLAHCLAEEGASSTTGEGLNGYNSNAAQDM
jgi:nucleoside-diphosphate-sugar epimerase